MKKILGLIIVFIFFLVSSATLSSCNRKTGCPMNEKVGPKTNKQGQLKVPKRRKPAKLF